MKETKYLNYLIDQNWTVNGPEEPDEYCPKFAYTGESPAGLEIYGFGETAERALDSLEENCKEWLTQIEAHLNLEFVEK